VKLWIAHVNQVWEPLRHFRNTLTSDSAEPCRLVLEVVGKHASSPCDVALTAMMKGSRTDGTCDSSPQVHLET
jgi:hypothetical protein